MRYSMLECFALAAALLIPVLAQAEAPAARGPEIDLKRFKMTFNDEFDGNSLDTSKWQAPEMPRQGTSRWVASLVSVRDGMLHLGIRLSKDPVLRYDCAGIRTRKDYDVNKTMFMQRYGYFEARCRMPKNLKADYWGSFWMMCGSVNDKTPDTRDGLEVDILETFHFATRKAYSLSFHWNGYGAKHNMAGVRCAETPEALDGGFHRYGLYWDEKYYVAFFDGVEVGRTELLGLGSKAGGKTQSQGPCRKPGYVKLCTEAAPWVGATSGWEKEMAVEDDFVVDYVRVYEGTLPAPTAVMTKVERK